MFLLYSSGCPAAADKALFLRTQDAAAVEDHGQCRRIVDDGGPERVDFAESTEKHCTAVDENRRHEVLLNEVHRASAELQSFHEAGRIFRMNRDSRGFCRKFPISFP